ncbi:MAG: hypothetical protein U0929_09200 [Planctomycetaceae bacterium]
MLKKYLWVVALGLAVCGAGVSAQEKVTVYYPDGTVRIEDAAPAKKSEEKAAPAAVVAAAEPAPAPAPAGTPTPCPGCGGDNGQCTPECRVGVNLPEVHPLNTPECNGDPKCTDIPVPPVVGQLEVVPGGDEDFYDKCENYPGKVRVPVLVENKKEFMTFKRHAYTVGCCEYKVCIPCKCCTQSVKKCELRERNYTVKVAHRKGTEKYDVYVLNVPGMPTEWVLVMDGTKQDVKDATGVTLP